MLQPINEYLIFLLAAVLIMNAIYMARVIYVDAKKRNTKLFSPVLWSIGVIFVPYLFGPLYGFYASKSGKRNSPIKNHELWTVWLFMTLLAATTTVVLLLAPNPETNLQYNLLSIILYGMLFYYLIFKKDLFGTIYEFGAKNDDL